MRLLLIKTSSMGDVLHTLPALTDAMRLVPELTVDWVVEEGFAEIPAWHPAVANVIPVAIRRWRKNWFNASIRRERQQFKQQLQARTYDLIIDAQGLLKSAALITCLAAGPKHGLNWQSAKEPLASLFYRYRHPVSRSLHAIERIRQLFALSFDYSLPQEPGDYAIAATFQAKPVFQSIPESPYLVFLHATSRPEKHWPEFYWQQLITHLADSGLKILLPWGTEEEHQRAIRLAKGSSHVSVLPRLSLNALAHILSGAEAIVSVDTGLSHLAAALDRPNLTLYGPTDPGLIGSYGKHQLAMVAADKKMSSLLPREVLAKLSELPSASQPKIQNTN